MAERGWLAGCGRSLLQLFVCCLLLPVQALHVFDDKGEPLVLAQPAQRIVSLLPSLSESVCALGQCHRLVGVDAYSNYPASLRKLPNVGAGLEPSIEAIVALKPDLVLLATSSRASERLRAMGLKVLVLEPKTHADLRRTLATLGVLMGLPDARAQQLWLDIHDRLQSTAQRLSPQARRARVYVEVGRGPYAASESSFIGETLARLGASNIVPASLGPFPQLNPEFVLRADPDLIIVGSRSSDGLVLYPGWAGLRAVRAQHVCVLNPDQSDVLARPGPRLADAAELIARCLEEKMR
jgi:iron complex transport system substrate-binding protein